MINSEIRLVNDINDINSNYVVFIDTALASNENGVYRVERQDASFLLRGKRVLEVFAQTCGYNFVQSGNQLVMTQVVGVPCSILKIEVNGVQSYRIWFSPSYGVYMWQTLLQIVQELGGGAIGVEFLLGKE